MPTIRRLLMTKEVEEKIWNLHRLTRWGVERVVFDPESDARWDIDPEHGGRVVIRGFSREHKPREIFVALTPIEIDSGTWSCITAFSPSSSSYGK